MDVESIKKQDLIAKIIQTRGELEDLIQSIPEEKMEQPLTEGWSVKDILSHIIAWENNMVGWVGLTLAGGAPENFPDSNQKVDALNEFQFQRDKGKALKEVLEEFPVSYKQALNTAQGLSEEFLNEVNSIDWRQGIPIWYLVASNTYWHYEDHFETLRSIK